jgi:hypothetical protein
MSEQAGRGASIALCTFGFRGVEQKIHLAQKPRDGGDGDALLRMMVEDDPALAICQRNQADGDPIMLGEQRFFANVLGPLFASPDWRSPRG